MKLYYCKEQSTGSDFVDLTDYFLILNDNNIIYSSKEANMLEHIPFNGKIDLTIQTEEEYENDEGRTITEEMDLDLIKVSKQQLRMLNIEPDSEFQMGTLLHVNRPASYLFQWLYEHDIITEQERNELIKYHKEKSDERYRHIS